nr:acyl-CoA dehydrogenase family protein [Mycobacteroides abscessus]
MGERGRGYAGFLRILDEGRIAIAAVATGAAQGCVDESLRYARSRPAFGSAIIDYQSVSFKIARMQARAHTARLAYYHAAALLLAGKPFKTEASIAKLIASEAAMDNARDATQIFGGAGFMNESGTDITAVVGVAAVTGRSADGSPEISVIHVPSGTTGFTVEPGYDKVGWHASDTHPLSFDDVRVPYENLLGERGRGYAGFLRILDEGRIAIAAVATGAAQGCVDESLRYARSRPAFGSAIIDYQSVSFKIARMQARAHTARLAYYHAAALLLAGKPFKTEASIAKLIASEAAMDNARDATQIFGGAGFMNESPVARQYRDSKILEIGEGTSEVQLMLIARALTG